MRILPTIAAFLALGPLGAASTPAAVDLPLIDAVKMADPARVERLLAAGAAVDEPQGDRATALHWAAHGDLLDVAALLVGAGADVDADDDHGLTPLAMACLNASVTMVDLLLEAGADPNLAQTSGVTPLMTAARVGQVEVVRRLLRAGSDPDARLERPLPLVSRRITQDNGLTPTTTGSTPFLLAASFGDVVSMRILVEGGADPSLTTDDNTTALMVAAVSDATEATSVAATRERHWRDGSTVRHTCPGDDRFPPRARVLSASHQSLRSTIDRVAATLAPPSTAR